MTEVKMWILFSFLMVALFVLMFYLSHREDKKSKQIEIVPDFGHPERINIERGVKVGKTKKVAEKAYEAKRFNS